MSWLSDRTGVHIGSGPKKVHFDTPLPIAQAGGDAAFQATQNQVNDTIGRAQGLNTGAEVAAGLGLGAAALGGGALGGGTLGAASGGGSSWVDGLLAAAKAGSGAALDFVKNHKNDLLQVAGIADAAYRQTQANNYAKQALGMAQDAYNAKAPLRSMGIAGLAAPSANPFAQSHVTPTAPLPLAPPQRNPSAIGQPPRISY